MSRRTVRRACIVSAAMALLLAAVAVACTVLGDTSGAAGGAAVFCLVATWFCGFSTYAWIDAP